MRKILIIGAFLIFFIPVKGIADDSLDVGSFSFGGKLQLDGWAHQLGDGWSVTKVAGGLNNNYSYNPSTATSNAMSTKAISLTSIRPITTPTHISECPEDRFLKVMSFFLKEKPESLNLSMRRKHFGIQERLLRELWLFAFWFEL